MSRSVATDYLDTLGRELTERERRVVRLVSQLRLVSHAQLAVVLDDGDRSEATAASRGRDVRRILSGMTARGLLARLERRVGGVRAGSSGYVYYLGSLGQKLIAYWDGKGLIRGRRRPEPSARYVDHRLAVSNMYVKLIDAERGGRLELLEFAAEPDCWRPYIDRFGGQTTLKPDAYVHLGLGAFEERAFVEVDLGTESRSVIAAKARTYWDYFRTGAEQAAHGVFPRVTFLTNNEARRESVTEACARLPAEAWQLFAVVRLDQAVELLSGTFSTGSIAPDATQC